MSPRRSKCTPGIRAFTASATSSCRRPPKPTRPRQSSAPATASFSTPTIRTFLVSEHAASLAYDVLPRELVELIKQIVLDTLGVAIGASGLAPEARVVAEYVEAFGGRPESTVFGFGFKAPAPWAAFVNGSL